MATPLRWLAGTVIALSIIGVALVLLDGFSGSSVTSSNGAGSLLPLVLVSVVSGAGVTLLVGILLSTALRDKQALATTSQTTPLAQSNLSGALTKEGVRLMRGLTRSGYWLSGKEGAFEQIDPAHDDTQLRLTELLGKHRKSLAVDDASREALAGIARQTAARLPYRDVLWRCRLPGGQCLNLRESGMPRYDVDGEFCGYHGFIEDISSQALDPIRTQLVTQALEVLPMPLALLHLDLDAGQRSAWKLVWANAPMTHLTGRSQIELSDEPLHHWLLCAPENSSAVDLTGANSRRRTGPALDHFLNKGDTHQGNGLVLDRYGRRRQVVLTLEEIDAGQPGNHLMLIAADPTSAELRKLQSSATAVEASRQELAKRRLEIEVTTRELESFSHTVSHDLRHPLRIVDGFVRIIQEDYGQLFDQAGVEHLNRILSAAHRMNSMIDALIELHSISSQPIADDPIDLTAMASEICEELREDEATRDVDVWVEPNMSCRGDRLLIRMALFNLIQNAWKYTSKTSDATISIDTVSLDDTRVYRVTDNGAGFDMRFADRLFNLFHRLHGQSDFQGSGVGLATVQRIIRRHSGRIWASATLGKGACFQFTLWDACAESLPSAAEADTDPAQPNGTL